MEAPEHWRPRAKYINLYLNEEQSTADGATDHADKEADARLDLHAFIERKLKEGLVLKDPSARKEARLWLGATLGLLDADDPRLKHRYFLPFLRSSSSEHREFLHSAVLLVCQTWPAVFGRVLKHDAGLFRRFFRGQDATSRSPPPSPTPSPPPQRRGRSRSRSRSFSPYARNRSRSRSWSRERSRSRSRRRSRSRSRSFSPYSRNRSRSPPPARKRSRSRSRSPQRRFRSRSRSPSPRSRRSATARARSRKLIAEWFDHFSYTDRPQKGAAALEHYCLAERDHVWNKLVWRTGIPVSPVIAVQTRARLAELDPVGSVRAMLAKEPAFFASEPFQRSVEDGGFLSLDYDYFATFIEESIRSTAGAGHGRQTREEHDQAMELRAALEDFVGGESLQKLCDHFLPYLHDDALFDLVRDVRDHHRHRRRRHDSSRVGDGHDEDLLQSELAQFVIVECRWRELDDLLLANAMAFFAGRLVKHLTSGDEGEELGDSILAHLEKQRLTLASRDEKANDARGHWALRRRLCRRLPEGDRGDDRRSERRREDDEADVRRRQCRFICAEAFLLRYRLTLDFVDERSLKKIMTNEGIAFRPVYVTTERKRRKGKGKKEKKEKTKKKLVGWRFPSASPTNVTADEEKKKKKRKRGDVGGDDDDDEMAGGLTYGVPDTPGYFVGRFTRSALHCFRASPRGS